MDRGTLTSRCISMALPRIPILYLTIIVGFTYGYENLALGRSTWQSTSFDSTVGSSKAVDGLKSDLSYRGKQCSISMDNQTTATWWVNLGGLYSIHNIVIYYRTDNFVWNASNDYKSRFLGFSVYISNTTNTADGKLCFSDKVYTRATIPAVAHIICPVHGQYVIYYNERLPNIKYSIQYSKYAFVELCEVEVYGCSGPRQYGSNCSLSCATHCKEHCHIESGNCLQCNPGYKGELCEQECDLGQYGLNCQEACGKCQNQYPCHHVNGTCKDGCVPGYTGDKCDEVCGFGNFGDGCKEECSAYCKKTRDCNHVSGTCVDGCKVGWQGHSCFQIQAKEEPDWQSRFYGVLAAFCVSVTVIIVFIVIMCLQRWRKGGANTQQSHKNPHPQFNMSYIDEKTEENVKSEYQELSERTEPSSYDTIQ